jgi:hypothetical protein
MKIVWLAKLGKWLSDFFGNKEQNQSQETKVDVSPQITTISSPQINNSPSANISPNITATASAPSLTQVNVNPVYLTVIKTDAIEAFRTTAQTYGIPNKNFEPYLHYINDSQSPGEVLFMSGSLTGSTAQASGIPEAELKDKFWSEFKKKSISCPYCLNQFSLGELIKFPTNSCPKCGRAL